jgi:hypothetical protein
MPKKNKVKNPYRKSHRKSHHKSYTRRNNRALNKSKRKKSDVNLDVYKKNLEELSKVKYKANASEEDLEIHTINNRIIYLMLLKLLVIGTTSAVEMASKYAHKNKINLNKVRAGIPTIKSHVDKIKTKGIKPDFAAMHIGWEAGLCDYFKK